MHNTTVHYLIHDAGDGTAYPTFYKDRAAVTASIELEKKRGNHILDEGFINIDFDVINGNIFFDSPKFISLETVLKEIKEFEEENDL